MLKILTLAFVCITSLVKADDISLGIPAYGGNGCPQGTVSATLSPDTKQLSILFDQYTVQASGATKIDRKSCNLAIPIRIPQGMSVSVVGVDYRGFNGLPRGATSVLSNQYFFAGSQGPTLSKTFTGPLNAEYLVSNKLQATAVVWSPCGAETNIRINSSMRVSTNAMGEQALATVDSVDLSAGLIYQLQWRSCR